MSNSADIVLRIRSDARGATDVAAALRRIEQATQNATRASAQQATAAARQAAAQARIETSSARASTALRRQERETVALATADQRLARETANAAAAQDRAASAALRRAAAEQRAAQAAQGTGGIRGAVASGITDAAVGGLTGLAAGVGVGQAVQAGNDALELRRTLALTRELTGSTEQYTTVLEAARQQQRLYGGTIRDNIAGIQGLVITARSSGAQLEQLIGLSQRLALLDPSQGPEGARIALSEALSGDPRSLALRYEIPRTALRELTDASKTAEERLQVLDGYLNRIGITSEAVGSTVSRQAIAYNEFAAALDNVRNLIGGGAADLFAPSAQAGADVLNVLDGTTDSAVKAYEGLRQLTGQYRPLTDGERAFAAALAERLGFQRATTEATGNAVSSDQAFAATRAALDRALQAGQISASQYVDAVGKLEGAQLRANNAAGVGVGYVDSLAGSLRDLKPAGDLSNSGLFAAAAGMDAVQVAAREAGNATARMLGILGGVNSETASIGGSNTAAGGNGLRRFTAGAQNAVQDAAKVANILSRASNPAAPRSTRAGGGGRSPELKTVDDLVRARDLELLKLQGLRKGTDEYRAALERVRDLEERILDAKDRQVRAALDLRIAQVEERRTRREEDQRLRQAERIANSSTTSEQQKQAARDVLELIPLERARRELDLQRTAREAQGATVELQAGAVQVYVDGKLVEGRIVTNFRQAVQRGQAQGAS